MGGQAHVPSFIRTSILNFISMEKEFYRAEFLGFCRITFSMIHVTKHWARRRVQCQSPQSAAIKTDDGALPVLVISHFEELKLRECNSFGRLPDYWAFLQIKKYPE